MYNVVHFTISIILYILTHQILFESGSQRLLSFIKISVIDLHIVQNSKHYYYSGATVSKSVNDRNDNFYSHRLKKINGGDQS